MEKRGRNSQQAIRPNDKVIDEKVKGCIIGTQEDRNLLNAISMVPDIDFYRYNIDFSLNRVEF